MNKLKIGLLAVIILLLGVAGAAGYYVSQQARTPTPSTYITISATEAKQLIETEREKGLLIIDVRTEDEYAEGHIEGAVNILVEMLQGSIYYDEDTVILVYGHTDVRSSQASQILIDEGFTRVYNINGGLTAWINEGFPIVVESTAESNGCCG